MRMLWGRSSIGWVGWSALSWSLTWLLLQLWGAYQAAASIFRSVPRVNDDASALLVAAALPRVGSFLLVLLALHLLFALVNAAAFRALLSSRLELRQQRLALVAQLLLVTLAFALFAAWKFPQSILGDQIAIVFYQASGKWISVCLVAIVVLYFTSWAIFAVIRTPRKGLLFGAVTACVFAVNWLPFGTQRLQPEAGAPDVIVIGVDSLRPDHLARNGAPFALMPNVESVLNQSVVFSDVLSPQPHTFPATVSILTGQWPTTHGARGNLFPPGEVNRGASMAHDFAAAGYATLYGMDETRFANIDAEYGFHDVASPGFGVGEIATGMIGDSVLSNLFSLLPVSRWLLPDIFGNRALAPLYRPEAFSRRLSAGLSNVPADKPLFLYVHFCAAHWPYIASHLYEPDQVSAMPSGDYSDAEINYLRGLHVVDGQVGRLLEQLRGSGRLANAVVTLLSDHGEDFDLQRDKWPDGDVRVPGGIVNGHGGSAIREPQVSVLLAFARFGRNPLPTGTQNTPASLVDVAPTLAALAGLDTRNAKYDGIPLLAAMGQGPMEDRIRYVESSYFPESLKQKSIDEVNVLREMAQMYEIASDGRIEVKPAWLNFQRKYRQRAAYLRSWALMASDDPNGELLVVDRKLRKGWPLSRAPASAPSVQLRQAWCTHWRGDGLVDSHCQ